MKTLKGGKRNVRFSDAFDMAQRNGPLVRVGSEPLQKLVLHLEPELHRKLEEMSANHGEILAQWITTRLEDLAAP